MPDRVFDIIRVDGLVELELLDTFLVLVGVVVGNASLPVMRLLVRVELNKSIEIGNRLFELSKFKIRDATRLVGTRGIWILINLPSEGCDSGSKLGD